MASRMESPEKRERSVLLWYVAVLVMVLGIAYGLSDSSTAPVLAVWVMGAAALGIATGFTAGASTQPGTATQLIALYSTGILVPILGGVVALLKQPETTTETNTYSGEQLTQRISAITTPGLATEFHPLWVAGSFFIAYSIAAMIGIAIGVRRRNETVAGQSGGMKVA